MESPHGEPTGRYFSAAGVPPAEVATQMAARHGVYLNSEVARAVAAAVLDAHDNIVTAAQAVMAEVWADFPEEGKEDIKQDLVRRILVDAVEHGAIPVELPRVEINAMPGAGFPFGNRVEVRASMRVRYVAREASAVPEQEAER